MIEKQTTCREFEKSVTRLRQKPSWYPVYLSGIIGVILGGVLVGALK
jgi:hypothetical protein